MLLRVTKRRQNNYGHFPFFNEKNSVVLFGFVMNNVADGIAARVWTYSDPGLSQVEEESTVSQAKKRTEEEAANVTARTHHWPLKLNFKELEDRIKSGQ